MKDKEHTSTVTTSASTDVNVNNNIIHNNTSMPVSHDVSDGSKVHDKNGVTLQTDCL